MEINTHTEYHEFIDQVEGVLANEGEQVECPITHHFTKGLYCREMFIPKGTILTSKIHNTEHPFVLSMGAVAVLKENEVIGVMVAPYFGITVQGTRRIIYAHEDSVWTTFHPVDITPKSDSEEDIQSAVDEIEELIICKHDNKYIDNKKEEQIWLGY